MSDNMRMVLGGIVLMLAGLFCLGICILNEGQGMYPDWAALILEVGGFFLAAVGIFRGDE